MVMKFIKCTAGSTTFDNFLFDPSENMKNWFLMTQTISEIVLHILSLLDAKQ